MYTSMMKAELQEFLKAEGALMTDTISEYIELHRQIVEIQKEKGEDSAEEEEILCKMDVLWYRLTPEEMKEMNSKNLPLL